MEDSEGPDQPGLFGEPGLLGEPDAAGGSSDELVMAGWDPPDDGDPEDGPETWLAALPAELRAEVLARPVVTAPPWADGRAARAAFGDGGVCDTMPPSWFLDQVLSEATAEGYARLGDDELAGVLRACQRQISGGYAALARAVAELAERRAEQSARPGWSGLAEHVTDELAAELTLTGRSAGRLLDVAGGLRRLPEVAAALEAGRVDWPRACVFVDELSVLGDEAARQVAGRLADRAAGWTTGQLRAALARAVLAADPGAAERRKSAARQETRVETWHEPSGNATLAGRELPPAKVIAADARLTADADWLRRRGAPGTLAELRAAAFLARLSGQDLAALLPPATTDGAGPDSAPAERRPGGTIHLTMPLSTWLGGGAPGEVAGHGLVHGDTSRELGAVLARDPATRWCVTFTGPGGRAAGHACARRGPGVGEPVITWAAGLRPAMRRLELARCRHDRESAGYRPPSALAHLVRIRQRRCCFPGCRRAAVRCDLDHTIPFDQGGRTCECNLAPLCRRHHRAKQTPRWHLSQDQPGEMTWRLPSGRIYHTAGDPYPI